NRQLIVYFFPTAHRLVYVAPSRQLIVEIDGGRERWSRPLGTRSRAQRGLLRPRKWPAGDAPNPANSQENACVAARPPVSLGLPRHRCRWVLSARTATNCCRKCRVRPTFMGVMWWRENDPPD